MKKIISILLAVMLVVSVAAVSSGAVEYHPTDSYTVTNDTPTCEEAIDACGGDSKNEVQYLYFQLPLPVEGDEMNTTWTNKFNSTDLGLDYCQVCLYWWGGIGSKWPDGTGVAWVGYKTTLVDPENRIYRAAVPNDGNTPLVIWNNGVNGGMDDTKEIFNYARQLADANIEGAYEGDYDTLPEGTPNEDNMDGCIQIIDYEQKSLNALTGFYNYGSNWYVYYGDGCYGYYPTTSANYHGKYASCVNPEHNHPKPGDVNNDKSVDVLDVLCIQYQLAGKELPEGQSIDLVTADVDGDGYVTIIDATRIQRYLAKLCNIDGTKPYKNEE
ncbi:MAG: dockerin type I repeat-containing protein [Ruminococcus sp.]|nr:dockerin type I repeat-containing protein [Ruminococcus sp.]